MRLGWRDGVATVLVAVVVGFYVEYLVGEKMPLITDRGDLAAVGLILGFSACIVGGWSAATSPLARIPRILSATSVFALVLGIAVLATDSSSLLAVFIVTIATLWLVTTIRHAANRR